MGRAAAPLALVLLCGRVVFAQVTVGRGPLVQLSSSIRELTERVTPAVVEIAVTAYAASSDESGQALTQVSEQHSTGSGVVVDPAGFIMTNAHVVQGAIQVKVLTAKAGAPGGEPAHDTLDARILGIDRQSDLALLRVDAKGLRTLPFGDSGELRQGDLVLAIGSPLGLRNSVSMGVVSSPARAITDDNPILYIQTDAPINPGNSGGALIDAGGNLVGLNTFILSQSGGNEGIGFAIPSNLVRNVYQQLKKKGRVSRGTVGLFVENITPVLAKGLDLPLQHGIVVADVTPEGPAEWAGIKRRDIVVSVDGALMETARQFDNTIALRQGGETLVIVIQRGSSRQSLNVKVAAESAEEDSLATLVSPDKSLIPRLGIFCIAIDQQVAQLLPDLRRQYGVIVAAKSPDGQAQYIDVQPGDVIHSVNNLPVSSLDDLRASIAGFQRGDAVVLQIERDSRFRYVAFQIQ